MDPDREQGKILQGQKMKTSILLKKILSALNDIEKLIIAGQFEDANEIGISYFNEMKSQIPQFFRLRFFSALVSTSKLVLEDQIYYNMGKKKALKDIAETKKFFIQNILQYIFYFIFRYNFTFHNNINTFLF